MTFGGVEALLIPAATAALGVRFTNEAPADLATVVPLCRLWEIGGGDDDDLWRLGRPTVVVDSFAFGWAATDALAWQVHEWFRTSLPAMTLYGSTVTKVQTLTRPSRQPWDDTAVRRRSATYVLHILQSV